MTRALGACRLLPAAVLGGAAFSPCQRLLQQSKPMHILQTPDRYGLREDNLRVFKSALLGTGQGLADAGCRSSDVKSGNREAQKMLTRKLSRNGQAETRCAV